MARTGYLIAKRMTATEIAAGNVPAGFVEEIDANGQPTGNAYLSDGINTPSAVQSATSGIKNNFAATTVPGLTNDSSQGYAVGSRWINISSNESYVCTNAGVGGAQWSQTTVGTIAEVSGLTAALGDKEATANKDVNSGYAGLDATGKVPVSRMNTDTTREATANKNVANGYAGLDATGKVLAANMNTDTTREATANKNIANGYAGLDTNSHILATQLPTLAITTTTSLAPIMGAKVGLPGYRRCKLIPINSTTTGSGDYQVELKIGESSGSVGADFHLGGNSQSFPTAQKIGGEFKFVLPDGTDIPFFTVELTGVTPNRIATVFLRLAGLTAQSASVQKLVFLLYDNNILSITSQMSAIGSVFNLLADDFDAATLDTAKWIGTSLNSVFANSVLSFGGGNVARGLKTVATFGDNLEILSRHRMSDTTASYSVFGFDSAPGTDANSFVARMSWDSAASNTDGVYVGTVHTSFTNAINDGAGSRRFYRLGRTGGNGRFVAPDFTQNFTGVPTASIDISTYNTYDNATEIDWISVRQYLAFPPTLGTIQDV